MSEHIKIVEINGVKMEIDLRHATVVEKYKVGDNVKVLIKQYSSDYKTHPGVIIGFDDFKNLPTITVAYVDIGYNTCELKFIAINATTKDTEIAYCNPAELAIDKTMVLSHFDREITKKQMEVSDLEAKRNYMLKHMNKYFHEYLEKEVVTS